MILFALLQTAHLALAGILTGYAAWRLGALGVLVGAAASFVIWLSYWTLRVFLVPGFSSFDGIAHLMIGAATVGAIFLTQMILGVLGGCVLGLGLRLLHGEGAT
ncbi:MAG: hypothetical protein AAGG57_12285 [Pseudomonadota bacterium]